MNVATVLLSSDLNETGIKKMRREKRELTFYNFLNLPEIKIASVRRDETGFNLIENPPALHDAKAEGNDFRGEEEVDNLQGDQ